MILNYAVGLCGELNELLIAIHEYGLEGFKLAHPFGDRALVEMSSPEEPVALDSFSGTVHVRWAPDEAVTPLGQLPFFIDYLKRADLFAPFVTDCPLRFTSPNAPKVRDVWAQW